MEFLSKQMNAFYHIYQVVYYELKEPQNAGAGKAVVELVDITMYDISYRERNQMKIKNRSHFIFSPNYIDKPL